MDKLILITWIALYPVACIYCRYLNTKKELLLDPNFKTDQSASCLTASFEIVIYVGVWIYFGVMDNIFSVEKEIWKEIVGYEGSYSISTNEKAWCKRVYNRWYNRQREGL